MLLALAINQPITTMISERRPYMVFPELLVLAQHSLAFGFPSHHAVFAGATTATLFLVNRANSAAGPPWSWHSPASTSPPPTPPTSSPDYSSAPQSA
ncbi:hypothetical protein ACTXG6_33725 [Pseudonocardia sp. Cha107L01]|uniref:hypothetical protein n=1 Tax=Pseudonocardia sp. Cha107L01 TaxID=3457576 RepID=UPI00403E80D9